MNFDDTIVMNASQALAQTYIEKMDSYEDVKTLISNAEDVISRAKERLDELWSEKPTVQRPVRWNTKFTVWRDGIKYPHAFWIHRQSNRLRTRCYTCNELVEGKEPRFRVQDAPKARETTHSRGVLNEWNCIECALKYYNTRPPV